jgi:hypothetical protein
MAEAHIPLRFIEDVAPLLQKISPISWPIPAAAPQSCLASSGHTPQRRDPRGRLWGF